MTADAKKDSSKQAKKQSDSAATSGTGTVFAPNAAAADPLVNPYDLTVEPTAPVDTSQAQAAPPQFAEPPQPAPAAKPAAAAPAPAPSAPASGQSNDLLAIKQQALQNLTPLVDKLEQTPEDKFKTTMMLIQASDNPALVQKAYEAANKIPDEKARAQALLDVVNEINYFTQKQQPTA